MRTLSLLPATRLLPAAFAASVAVHGAGIGAVYLLHAPERPVIEEQPIVIEIVAAAPAIAAGNPEPQQEAVTEPVPETVTVTPPVAEQKPVIEPPVVQEPLPAFEIGIAALPPEPVALEPLERAEPTFLPSPTAKPEVPAEPVVAARVEPVVPAEKTETAEPARAEPEGEAGNAEVASLPQAGESLIAADYADAALGNQPPRYPRRAKRDGLEGRVILSVRVSAAGAIDGIKVKQTSGHTILDRAAIRAVEKWKFKPAQKGGEPVADEVTLPFLFRLKDIR